MQENSTKTMRKRLMSKNNTKSIQEKVRRIFSLFEKHNPNPTTELHYRNEYELLVAVILSAQCTDKRVNQITPALFKAYPTIEALASTTSDKVYELIKSCSYPNNKAKNLVAMAKYIAEHHHSQVPQEMDELLKVPGVGRKTANVILSVAFKKPALAVDTHVFRVSARIGLTQNAKTPEQAEEQLLQIIPKRYLADAHHWLILHGRYICTARNPKCAECFIASYCDYFNDKRKNV